MSLRAVDEGGGPAKSPPAPLASRTACSAVRNLTRPSAGIVLTKAHTCMTPCTQVLWNKATLALGNIYCFCNENAWGLTLRTDFECTRNWVCNSTWKSRKPPQRPQLFALCWLSSQPPFLAVTCVRKSRSCFTQLVLHTDGFCTLGFNRGLEVLAVQLPGEGHVSVLSLETFIVTPSTLQSDSCLHCSWY